MNLHGQRVLVVGGSAGIGRATAERFVRATARVTIAAREGSRLREAASAMGVDAVALDVLDARAIEQFFEQEPPFDHVVVSAAVSKVGTIGSLSIADAQATMDSKFWGAYLIARSAKITKSGSLTLVSGLLGVRPQAGAVLQGAINAALEALGRGLALDLAPVRVNTISPGLIDTPVHDDMTDAERQRMFEHVGNSLPVGRIGRAEEVAEAIFMIATNGFATGCTLHIDGGATIA